MPPTGKSVLLLCATSAPVRTFRNYVGHLRKGCALLGDSPDCETKAVYAESDVLRKARKGTFKSQNFLFMSGIFNLADFLGCDRAFALLAFISSLFPLMVPSEALLLRRAFRDDPIGEPVNQSEKALVGRGALSIKLACRKNLEGGRMIRRNCICEVTIPRSACPPRGICHRIRDRVNAGAFCPPSYNKNNFNRRL